MSKTRRHFGRPGAVSLVTENSRRRLVAQEREPAEVFDEFDRAVCGSSYEETGPLYGGYDPAEDVEDEALDATPVEPIDPAVLEALFNPSPEPEITPCWCGVGNCYHERVEKFPPRSKTRWLEGHDTF